jgi:hypothetical protein
VGLSTVLIVGRTAPAEPYWLVWGGNTDPGDPADDSGGALNQLIAGGWTTDDNATQVKWAAAIEQGTARITTESMTTAHAAYDEHCRGGRRCILAGFSLGNSPALQLASEVGHPAELTYLFGAPQPAPGVFHNAYLDNPAVEPWFVTMSGLSTDRVAPAGVQNFYDGRDPYANSAPQCAGPGLYTLTLDGHRIISKADADASRVWTGPDGVVNHEVPGPPPIASGADPASPLALCPPGGWYSPTDTRANPGPAPGVPGQPDTSAPQQGEVTSEIPGAPAGGLPAPSSSLPIPTEAPALGLPGLPAP